MQEKIPNIENLVNDAPEFDKKSFDYTLANNDPETIEKELESQYQRFENKNSEGLITKVKELIKTYIIGKEEISYTDQRKEYVNDLTRITKECKSALFVGKRTEKKISELEEKISMSLMNDKQKFLKFNDYLTRLQDAIVYTESQLENPNSMQEESILKSQLNQLREREDETYLQLDLVSTRIKQTSLHKKRAKEYVRYSQTQNYKIQQTLQTAEYTIDFLEATTGLGEFLKAGSLAAKIHKIFEKSNELTEETDEILIGALSSIDNLDYSQVSSLSFEKANDFASQKIRNNMIENICEAKSIIEGI